jgi:hypothetical protein
MDVEYQLNSSFHLLGSVEDQVRFADSKAGFLATVQTLLVGPLIYNLPFLKSALHDKDLATQIVYIGLMGVYGILFTLSMTLVGLAVLPRFGKPKADARTKRSPSRLFFGRIAQEYGDDPARFVSDLASMSDRDWIDEVGVYLVDASCIATSKHRLVRRASFATVASVVSWCILIVALLGLGR